MIPLRFHNTLCALFCLLTTLALSQASYGGTQTKFSTIRLIKVSPNGLEQQVLPIAGGVKNLATGHLIGPIELLEKGATYSLEILDKNGGKRIILRTAPEEVLDDMRQGTIINALHIQDAGDDGNFLEFQLLNPEQEDVNEPVKLRKDNIYNSQSKPEGQTEHSIVKSMVVSPSHATNFLLAQHRLRNKAKTHPTLKALIETEEDSENAKLVKVLEQPVKPTDKDVDPRNLLMYPGDTQLASDIKPGLSPKQAILEVPDLISSLVDPKSFELHPIPTPEVLAKAFQVFYSRRDIPEQGYLTYPFFVGGHGDFVVPHETNQQQTSLKGDQYFLQIKEGSQPGERDIVVHRLHFYTVEGSVLLKPEEGKPLVLHLSPNKASLTSSDNQTTYSSVGLQNSLEELLSNTPLEKFIGLIDSVKLMNMVSKWVDHLHVQNPLTKPTLDEQEIIGCFNTQKTSTEQLKSHVVFSSEPTTMDAYIGFNNSTLHTTLWAHPQLPIGGVETDPIEITDNKGQKKSYTVHIRLTTPHSYVATLHRAHKRSELNVYNAAQNQVIFSGQSSALATVIVDYPPSGKGLVQLINHNGSGQSVEFDSHWDPTQNTLALLPIKDEVNVYHPNFAACIHLLAQAPHGVFYGYLDFPYLEQLIQPQSSLNKFDGTAFYPSSVIRNIPHRSPWVIRKVVGGLKRATQYAITNPTKSLTASGALAAGFYFGPTVPISAAKNALFPVAETVLNIPNNYTGLATSINAAKGTLLPVLHATSSYASAAATAVYEYPVISTASFLTPTAIIGISYQLKKMLTKRQKNTSKAIHSRVRVGQDAPPNSSEKLVVPVPTKSANKPSN